MTSAGTYGSNGVSGNGLTNLTIAGNRGYDSGSNYTFQMTLKRTTSDYLTIIARMSGGTLNSNGNLVLTYTDTSPNTNGSPSGGAPKFEYDTYCMRPSAADGTAANFDFTNFKVEWIGTCAPAGVVVQPSATSVYEDTPSTFGIISDGNDNGNDPNYQWQYSSDGGSTANNVGGANSASYTDAATPLSHNNYKYRCIVSNHCDLTVVTSSWAALTVSACTDVTISSSPTNKSVLAGQTADFYVTANGSLPVYQWQVKTNGGASFENATNGTGGTTTHYTTPTLTTSDNNNQYRCFVTNQCDATTATSGVATATVTCASAGITNQPVDAAAPEGSTATFTIVGGGSLPTYKWQATNDGAGTFSDISGATNTSYTTPATTLANNGKHYRCVVSVACDSSSTNSTAVTLTVGSTNAASFRSTTSGDWTNVATWQVSFGAGWLASGAYPTAANNTNTLIQTGHTVILSANQTEDGLVVQTNATLVLSNANLTVANGSATIDCDVTGTVLVAASGGAISGAGAVAFENGAKFVWGGSFEAVIPTATWADGTTCSITNGSTATGDHVMTGIDGQSFFDFVWDYYAQNKPVDWAITTAAVRRNLSITNGYVVMLNNSGSGTLTVGGNVTIVGHNDKGYVVVSGPDNGTLNLGGNLLVVNSAGRGLEATNTSGPMAYINFTKSGVQNVEVDPAYGHPAYFNWQVNAGSTVKLIATNLTMIDGGGSRLTNNGTFDLNGVIGQTIPQLYGSGVITNSGAATTLTVGAGSGAPDCQYDGVIKGNISLVKDGTNTVTLTGTNTYTGNTTVTNNILALSGSGSIGNSAIIDVTSGGTLDVSGRTDGKLTLGAGQTLKGAGHVTGAVNASTGTTVIPGDSIGTLHISGTLTVGGTVQMEIDRTNSPNCDRIAAGGITVSAGATLTVTKTGDPLVAADEFDLFDPGYHR